MAAPLESLERLLTQPALASRAPTRRLLVIVNPYASTMSGRLRKLVVAALKGRYEVDAIDTEARGHATRLAAEAAAERYDAVVVFAGDGTLNEAVNGLVGSETPITCLPGGATNVFSRLIGIPRDVVDATEHLLLMADRWEPRLVDLCRANDRWFTFCAGWGLDASVVKRVDSNPKMKARFKQHYFALAANTTFVREYLYKPPQLEVVAGDTTVRGVTSIIHASDPYTFIGPKPFRLVEGGTLNDGRFAGVMLDRANPIDMPFIAARVFSERLKVTDNRHIHPFSGASVAHGRSLDGREVPLQLDGDHVGDFAEVEWSAHRDKLLVVS